MINRQHLKQTLRTVFVALIFASLLNSCAASRLQNVHLAVRQHDWQKAQRNLEEHLQQNPRDGEALLLLAEVYGEQNQAGNMMSAIGRLRKLSPKYEQPADYLVKRFWIQNFNSGQKHMKARDYLEAVACFQRAVTIDSTNAYGLQKYADALVMSGKYYSAEKYYRRVLQNDPENPVLLNNLAEIYFMERKFRKAIRLCNEILAKDENDPNALLRRAYANAARGRIQDAEEDFSRAAESHPSERLYTDFGLMYFRNHQYRKAIRQFQEALNYSVEPLQLYRYLGEAYWRLKNYPSMASWYKKVVEISPNDLVGWKNLAVAYEALGQQQLLSEARLRINKLIRTN